MRALSKEQDQEKIDLVDAIRTAHTELEMAIGDYNAVMELEQDKVQGKLNALNERIEEAKEWAESVASDMQSYIDEQGPDWQDWEDCQGYLSWKEKYENLDADKVQLDLQYFLEVPDCDVSNDLENLPDEP